MKLFLIFLENCIQASDNLGEGTSKATGSQLDTEASWITVDEWDVNDAVFPEKMELSKKSHISERMRLLEARLGPKKDEQGCDENRPPIRHVPMYDDLDMFEEGGSGNITRRRLRVNPIRNKRTSENGKFAIFT